VTALRNQLGKFLQKDINQMALLLAKERISCKCIFAPHNCMQKYATSRQITFRPTSTMETAKEENLRDKGPSQRSKFSTNEVESKVCNGGTFRLSLNAVDLKEDNVHFKRAILPTYSLYKLVNLTEYRSV